MLGLWHMGTTVCRKKYPRCLDPYAWCKIALLNLTRESPDLEEELALLVCAGLSRLMLCIITSSHRRLPYVVGVWPAQSQVVPLLHPFPPGRVNGFPLVSTKNLVHLVRRTTRWLSATPSFSVAHWLALPQDKRWTFSLSVFLSIVLIIPLTRPYSSQEAFPAHMPRPRSSPVCCETNC